jgi:pimeloyl-ACP methyl ester carboxylesterase
MKYLVSRDIKVLILIVSVLSAMFAGRHYMGFVDLDPAVVNSRYANEESQFIKLDGLQQGIELHYRDEGKQDAPVLFLLHGIMASLQTWDGWVKALQDDFRIIRVDIPGFGLTGPYSDGIYNIERSVDMVDQLSDKLGIESFFLAGNSMGGYISWNFALVHPEKVKRLILLDAAGYPFKPPMMLEILQTPVLKQAVGFLTPRFIVTHTLNEVYGDASKVNDELIDRYHQLMLREGNRQAVVDVFASISDVDNSAIKQLKVPTLIQWGSNDAWIPLVNAQKFSDDIEGAKTIVYPGVGHIPMEEIAEISANDAKDFLRALIEEPRSIQPQLVTPVSEGG